MVEGRDKPTALITGASRGLGLALAVEMARRGWRLIIDARSAAPLRRAEELLSKSGQVVAIPGDIADAAHRQALAAAAARMGGLDVLFNNAGTLGPSPLPALLDLPLDRLAEIFAINTVAQLGLIQDLRAVLKPGARILNVTSDAAASPYPGWGGYGASKAALEQISAVLAVEAPAWRVYSVDPGDMRTQMQQDAYPGEDISDRPLPEESVPGMIALIEGDYPSGRYVAKELAPIHRK